MAVGCALCSVAVVAFFALSAVCVLSFFVDTGTVQLRATTSYAVVDCAPPPSPAARNSSAFRESLVPLLAALPAAAAPRGFASLHSDDHSAFVRGVCLGFDHTDGSCHACLAAAAENLTSSCLGASRRGGAWRSEGCFVAYADTNSSSAREDAFRDVVFSGEDPGGDPNCLDTRKLVALAQSMARRRDAKVFLGARVSRDAAAEKKNTVRVFPDVGRVKTSVRGTAPARRIARGAWATRRGRCRRAPGASTAGTCAWRMSSATAASCESRRWFRRCPW